VNDNIPASGLPHGPLPKRIGCTTNFFIVTISKINMVMVKNTDGKKTQDLYMTMARLCFSINSLSRLWNIRNKSTTAHPFLLISTGIHLKRICIPIAVMLLLAGVTKKYNKHAHYRLIDFVFPHRHKRGGRGNQHNQYSMVNLPG